MDNNFRWLHSDEQRAWRAFLTMNRLLFERVDRQLQCDAGMPHAYYEILVRLSEVPGHALRMSRLAESSTSSRSRLSHAAARLEEAGWVRRTTDPCDRRGAVAQLTDEGLAALAAAAPGHVTAVRETLFDALSPEQVDQLHAIAEAVTMHLGENLDPTDDGEARAADPVGG